MQEIFNFFNQSWVGIVIGIIIATFFYKKSRRAAKPSFQKSSIRLFKKENNFIDEVTVLFNEREVDRLTKTILILWNNGNKELRREEVADKDPIKISFNEGDHILSYKKLRETNKANEVLVSRDKDNSHQLLIDFSYLNPGDGISLELFHDSEDLYPKVHGSIMGLRGFEDLGELEDDIMPVKRTLLKHILNQKIGYLIVKIMGLGYVIYRKIGYLIVMIIGLGYVVLGLSPQEVEVWLIFVGLLYIIVSIWFLWVKRKKYPRLLTITEIER